MYGVIFIIEEIKFNKGNKDNDSEIQSEDKKISNETTTINAESKESNVIKVEQLKGDEEERLPNEHVDTENVLKETIQETATAEQQKPLKIEEVEETVDTSADPNLNVVSNQGLIQEGIAPIENNNLKLDNISSVQMDHGKIETVDEATSSQIEGTKSIDMSLNSKQYNLFGPFLGQVMGTVKDCCRKAFLNGEPRLYEAIYLCMFQVKIEHIGKIHSVINKRRGTVIMRFI